MCGCRWHSLVVLAAGCGLAAPVAGQDFDRRPVLHGRVEDAASREPIVGARVFLADSSSVAYSDSLGTFGIPVPESGPFTLWAEQFGYLSQRFDLGEDAPSQLSVLRLEPAPIEIEGITAEAEAALTRLVRGMKSRRYAAKGSVTAVDRADLERYAPATLLELIRARWPTIRRCASDDTQLCVPGRGRTMNNPSPEGRVLICVDAWTSLFPVIELDAVPVQSAGLVEIYRGEHQVRVYTPDWLLSRAETGRTHVLPLWMGC